MCFLLTCSSSTQINNKSFYRPLTAYYLNRIAVTIISFFSMLIRTQQSLIPNFLIVLTFDQSNALQSLMSILEQPTQSDYLSYHPEIDKFTFFIISSWPEVFNRNRFIFIIIHFIILSYLHVNGTFSSVYHISSTLSQLQ